MAAALTIEERVAVVETDMRHGDDRFDRIEKKLDDFVRAALGACVALVAFLAGQLYMIGVQPHLVSAAYAAPASR